VFNLNDKEFEQAMPSKITESHTQKPTLPELEQKDSDQITITVKKVSMLAAAKVEVISSAKSEIISTEWGDEGKYEFYTPTGLSKKTSSQYKESLENIATLHKKMHNKVKKLDIKALTPKSALTTIKISGSLTAISSLISQLRASSLSEVRWLAEQLQTGAQQKHPEAFADNSNSQNVLAQNNILYKIASQNLATKSPVNIEKVMLEGINPRNEFSLLIDALYPYSNFSRKEIVAKLEDWTYDQRKKAFTAALETGNSPILEEAYYKWDILADIDTVRRLKSTVNIQELQPQMFSANYGYDIPQEVERAGVDELYIESFDISTKLFDDLQEAGDTGSSEYATLSGHKNHWQFATNAHVLKSSISKGQFSAAKEILELMLEKITEHHPLIGNFINTSDLDNTLQNSMVSEKKEAAPKKRSAHYRRRVRKPKK
jgi:hypothetical protein